MVRVAAPVLRVGPILLLLVAAVGCSGSVHKAGNDLLSNHYYYRDRYQIDSPYGTWEYFRGDNKSVLTVGDGYRRRKLTDRESDRKVDSIEVNDRTLLRDDPGAGPLFAEADAEMEKYRGWIHVEETHAYWLSMTPSDLVKAAGS